GPEPEHSPTDAAHRDLLRQSAEWGRVILTGYGPDASLRASAEYPLRLLRQGRWLRLAADFAWQAWSRRRFPQMGLRSALRRGRGVRGWRFPYPTWMEPDLEARLDLRVRWEEMHREVLVHPDRAESYFFVVQSFWPFVFERYDGGSTGEPLEA